MIAEIPDKCAAVKACQEAICGSRSGAHTRGVVSVRIILGGGRPDYAKGKC